MSTVNIDVWSLFIALLVTALLQEFAIKPSVDLIKKYYHKSRKHVEGIFQNNVKQEELEDCPIEPLMKK